MSTNDYQCPFCGMQWDGPKCRNGKCPFCASKQSPAAEVIDPTLDKWADDANRHIRSLWLLGHRERATVHWHRALSHHPHHLACSFNLMYALWLNRQWPADVFLNTMRSLETRHGSNPLYWRCMAWIHFEQGNEEEVAKIQASEHRVSDQRFLEALNDEERPLGRLHCLIQKKPRELKRKFVASPDGRYALSFASDCAAFQLWNLVEGKAIICSAEAGGAIMSASFSSDSRYILSGSENGSIRLWSSHAGRELDVFQGHTGSIIELHFLPDQRGFISTSRDATVRKWGLKSDQEFKELVHFERDINYLAIAPDGRYMLAMGDKRIGQTTIIACDLVNDEVVWWHQGSEATESEWDRVDSFTFALGSRVIIGRSYDENTIYVWNFPLSSGPHELVHDEFITHMHVIPGNHGYLVTVTCDNFGAGKEPRPSTVWVWNIGQARLISRSAGHQDRVTAIGLDPGGGFFTTGSTDGSIKLWRLEDGDLMRYFHGHTGAIRSIGLSSDGRLMLSSGEDWTIRLSELDTGRNLRQFSIPAPAIIEASSIGFTPDSRYAYAMSSDVRFFKLFYSLRDWKEVNPHPLRDQTYGGG